MPGNSNSGGRNRKSAARHRLEGTYQKCRHDGRADPDPPKGRPTPPTSLAGDARAEWQRMVKRLEDTKTLSTVDDAALYQYSCLFAETEEITAAHRTNARLLEKLEQALERVRDEDQVAQVATAIADIRKLDAKHVQQLRQSRMALRQFLVEFGMTPAARSRVKEMAPAAGDQPVSKLAQLQAQAETLRRPIRVK